MGREMNLEHNSGCKSRVKVEYVGIETRNGIWDVVHRPLS